MPSTSERIAASPVDFESAVGYALHRDMRRLVILFVVGSFMVPFGLSMSFGASSLGIVDNLLGIAIAVVGAAFLFGGLIGGLFKLVTDATLLASAHHSND